MKTQFVCQNCGAFSMKWMGRCPSCGTFDSMVEEQLDEKSASSRRKSAFKPALLSDIPIGLEERRSVGLHEVDRVLGGGFVKGSVVLLGGDPGIGKSTLTLQIAEKMASGNGKALYISGEESSIQVRLRAQRLKIAGDGIVFLPETEMESILEQAETMMPAFLIIDSIQTVYKSSMNSSPGSVGQVRECCSDIMKFAKDRGIPTIIIGHVTKFGAIAGPKTLEHIVDTVLYFEGEKDQQYRILRASKNRFGSTNEIGVFEMTADGLVEVENPTSIFVTDSQASGSVIVSIMEGTRPLLLEVQALTNPTYFNYPQRVATGIDYKRLTMLLAVLERRVGINVFGLDCFLNVVGGIKVFETAIDLGIIVAVASAVRNKPVAKGTVIIGEVGLGGEVRSVWGIENRLREADKLGLQTAIIPAKSPSPQGIKLNVIRVAEARQAVEQLMNS
ncbi:MAG TPA: DNA repair protein RadA [bacterium]